MRRFAEIHEIAAARKGGAEALESMLATPREVEELARAPLSGWLSAMAKAVFQAGFNWSVIEAKWPGFEAAFDGFDPARVAFYPDEEMDRLMADKGVVRNLQKLQSVIANARFLIDLGRETGDGAAHLARWPGEDQAGLMALFSARGARLGGATGQRVCRMMGKDSYILSPSVMKRLALEGLGEKFPTSNKAAQAVQGAFNEWRAESGRPFTQISQILAMSVD